MDESLSLIHDMHISIDSPTVRSLSFRIDGDPCKQEMMCCAWKGLSGVHSNWEYTSTPIIIDPSLSDKQVLAEQVRMALKSVGVTRLPFFTEEEPLTLTVEYVLPKCPDERWSIRNGIRVPPVTSSYLPFPKQAKDIPHMLNFLVDSMEGVVYDDDESIISVVVKKGFPLSDATETYRGWSVVTLSTTPVLTTPRILPPVLSTVDPTFLGTSATLPINVD